MEVSSSDIQNLRSSFFKKIEESGLSDADAFHSADINRVQNSDDWLKRFLLHHDNDHKEALNMLWETCDWRKKFGTNDINEKNVNLDIIKLGGIFLHSQDKDGKRLFIFKSKKHVKGTHDFEELKRCLVYWMERSERERNGDPLSIFFDMDGAGLSNMDMDYTKYIISLFKSYYPYYLNNIYILEMAWILNAAFKIIKTWLPPKAVQKIKFLTKSNLKEYVDPEHALKSWGGLDEYVFEFVPEEQQPVVEVERKKVHFADKSPTSEVTPLIPKIGGSPVSTNSSLNISPSDMIVFTQDGSDLSGSVQLCNVDSSSISYKIKTTSPEKFRVRPSAGILPSGGSATISVLLQPGYDGPGLARDKFLVMYVPIQQTDLSSVDLTELWKNVGKEVIQHRLRCSLSNSSVPDNVRNGSVQDGDRQITKLSTEISKMHTHLNAMNEEIRRIQIQQWVTLILLILLIGLTIYLPRGAETPIEESTCFAPIQSTPPQP